MENFSMAIVKKNFKDVTSAERNLYQKALAVLEKRQIDYGVELLKSVVQRNPGFMEARSRLRAVEQAKTAELSPIAKIIANLKSMLYIMKAQTMAAKKPLEAMALTEEALALNLHQAGALKLLATISKHADAPFIGSEAIEIMLDMDPGNEGNLRTAAALYKDMGDGHNLLKVWQRLAAKYPENLEFQAQLREAAAMATMEQGRWDKEESAAEKAAAAAKNKKDADIGDRIIRADDDVRDAILKMEEKIAGGDESVDMRRKLAELYMRAKRYDDCIKAYEWIAQKMGTLDPAIDRCIEKAYVAIVDQNIEVINQSDASEEEKQAQIEQQRTAIYSYRLERYEERVRLYPNDLVCRFELAEVLWEGQQIDRALEQFQLAQRNPAHRLAAMTYLGRCFHAKGQNDMAVEQFQKVIAEMPVMDAEKMNTLYYMGITLEAIGDGKAALECFKQIYSANVNYRDVSARMNAYYESQKQA